MPTVQYALAGVSPYSHDLLSWGGVQEIDLDTISSIAGGAALTTSQAFKIQPFPYAYLYDIIVNYTGTGSGTTQVDVYNTLASGSSANSYLSSPFTLTPSVSNTSTFASARALGTLKTPDPASYNPTNWQTYVSNYVLAQGAVFSVRVSNANTLSNLDVVVLIVPSDVKGIVYG